MMMLVILHGEVQVRSLLRSVQLLNIFFFYRNLIVAVVQDT